MRISLVALAALGGASAFAPAAFTRSAVAPAFMSAVAEEVEVAEEAAVEEAAPAPEPVALSGLNMGDVRKTVAGLNKENFQESLNKIEGYLVNEAGATIYSKSMRRIAVQAKALGVEVPEGYAKAAKATEKRRVKQDAFIQVKIEEAAAAAAEAAAAEAEAAAEEPAAEEPAAEE